MLDQKIINLFDAYTHGAMTRKEFLQRLAQMAGSTVAAMALLPQLELNLTQANTTAADADKLQTGYVEYPSEAGPVRAYMAAPRKPKKRSGVVIIHENRGLNAHIEDVARRAALAGYTAIAPDGLSPLGGTPEDTDEARTRIGQLTPEAALQVFLGGLAYLRQYPKATGKTGCVGFCWGGAMANNLAVNDPQLNAAVAFYGRQPAAADVPKIKAALMLHYAGLDTRINAGIPDYEAALKANGVSYELFMYDGVNHAFHNDTAGPRYDKAAAKLAWQRTIAFFGKTLGK
ncbi:MAG: dienelactone hydrolase family protein [Lewinellaceae bacterium]|nr:dienelactone hydrolase family protein [Lewinellaceae bacterium]